MASAERCIQATTTTPSAASNESEQSGDSLTSGETSRTNTIGIGMYIEDADQLTNNRAAAASNRITSSLLTDDRNSQNLKQLGDESHGQELCTNTTTITQGATGFQLAFGATSGSRQPVLGQAAIPKMNSSVKFGSATSSIAIPVFQQASSVVPGGYADSSTIGTIRAAPTSQASGTTTAATHSRSRISSSAVSGSSGIETLGAHVTNSFCSTSNNLLSISNLSSGVGFGTDSRKSDCDGLWFLGQSKPIITNVTTTANNNPFGQFSTSGGTYDFGSTSSVRSPFGSSTLKCSTEGLFGQSSTSFSSQFPQSATNSSGSMGLFEQQSTSGSLFGSTRSTTPSGGFGFGQPQTSTSSGPFSFCSSNIAKAEGGDGKPSKENIRHNVFVSPQIFSGATNQDNALFGNQSAKSFSSIGSIQTSPFSGGTVSNESGGGVGYLGFGISQQQKHQISVIGQGSKTTSTSSNQPLSASISINDADQLINNTPAAEPFNNTVLRYLTVDEKSQTTKQRGYGDSGQVAPTTITKTAQGTTGLNSGFSQPVFGQAATPKQHFRTPKFDRLAQASDVPSFGDLARSGGSEFGNAPKSASSTFGTLGSGQCIAGFGSEGLSVIGHASTTTSTSSNQPLSANMSINDADQLINNTPAAEPFNNTVLRYLTVDEKSQTTKQRGYGDSGTVAPTTITKTSQGATGLNSGFLQPVFGQAATPKQHFRTPKFDRLAQASDVPSFGDLARSGGSEFGNAPKSASSACGTSGSDQCIAGFGSEGLSVIGHASTTTSTSSNQPLSANMSINDADQLINNTPAAEPFNNTVLRYLTVDEKSQTTKQRGYGDSGPVAPTTITKTSQGATGLNSGFLQPVFGQAATPKQHFRTPKFDRLAQASDVPSFGDLARSGGSEFGNAPKSASSACGTSGSDQCIAGFGSEGLSVIGHASTTTSTSSNQPLSANMSINDADQLINNTPAAEPFNNTVLRYLTVDEKSQTTKQRGYGDSGPVAPTTITKTSQGATGLNSGFLQPVFGQAATPKQHFRTPKFDRLAQASDVPSFGDLARSGGSEFGNAPKSASSACGTSGSDQCIAGFGSEGLSVIGHASTTTSTSSNQPLSANMSINDADQLINNTPAAEPFNNTVLRYLTVDEKSQTTKQRGYGDSGPVAPTTITKTSQGATGLNSGFLQPVFGQAATPKQHFRTPKFDRLAQASDVPSFGDLARSGGSEFRNAPKSASSACGTSGSDQCIAGFGSEGLSVIGHASTTTSTSSNQPLSANMSINDADQLINNTPAAEPFNNTVLRYLTVDEKSQTTKQRGYGDSGPVAPTTITKTSQGATGLNSGFLQPVFGQAATPKQHFRTPKFDRLAQASDVPSFGDLARSGGSEFGNAPKSASSACGTSGSDQCIAGFGSEGLSVIGHASTTTSTSSNQPLSANMSINDADQLINNTPAVEPFNNTVLRYLTVDEKSQTTKQHGYGDSGPVAPTTITKTSQGATGLNSGFLQPVFGQAATPKQHFRTPKFDRLAQASDVPSFGDLARSGGSEFGNAPKSASSACGTSGSDQCIAGFGSKGLSVIGQASTTTSTSSNQPLSASMSINAEPFNNTVLRYLTVDEKSQTTKQRGYGDSGQVAPTTITKIAQRATGLNSGFSQPIFGQAATPKQHFRTPKFDRLTQASDVPSFGDLARSGGSEFGNAPKSASSTFGTSGSGQCIAGFGPEDLSGSGSSSFGVKFGLAITSSSATTTSSIAISVFQQTSSVVPGGYADSSKMGTIRAAPTYPTSGSTAAAAATHSRSDSLGLFGQSKPIFTAGTTTASSNPFGQFSTSGGTYDSGKTSSVRSPFGSSTLRYSTAGLFGQSSTSFSSQFPESATNSRGSMGLFEQQRTSGSLFGSTRSATPSAGFGFGQLQTSTSSGPFSFFYVSSSIAESGDGIPIEENSRQNVSGSIQIFSNQDKTLFGNQGAKRFSSSGSPQTSSFSAGKFSSKSAGGMGHLGFGISQQQKQQTSVIGQASTTTSTSSNQPLSASMFINNADQLINNAPAAEPFNNTILGYLTVDEKSQTTKQRGYGDSGQVAPTTTTKTAQGATGLTSGFLQPVFGQAATPRQQFRTPKFDRLAQASDVPSFGDLARSDGSVFGNAPNSASSTFGTSGSGQCIAGFGPEGLSGSGSCSFGSGPSFKGYRS